ncbi:hypothetical protein [Halobacterium litoreum]|uniref:Uncharacterized protein n=1 Tax=Halobacterium litoreum TaxID=2039234 RepID=A0ABD5N9H1_9EURY|nr:hypothetical protein [Halobacterium litoreum]UHH12111.1 hypothetical protein LT972_08070 [Halobacterium litoreum]
MSALTDLRHIVRGVAVWAVWVVLTGRVNHDRTYGQLRRLTPKQLLAHALPLVLVAGVAVHLALNMPTEFKVVLTMGSAMGVALGGTLVVGTLLLDWHLTHA